MSTRSRTLWPWPHPWTQTALSQAPVLGLRHFGPGIVLALAALLWWVDASAMPKPRDRWDLLDIASEGLTAALLAVWLMQVRNSRPAGRVTDLLCLGLAGMLLGGWLNLLDEFWKLPRQPAWCHLLEPGLGLAGMVLFTWGLHGWRGEQRALSVQWQRRERLFREHRSLDGVTQLGDASYMCAQVALERQGGQRAQMVMLGWQGFEQVARIHGLAESERMLQAAGQLLLLNLRPDDLLCRYGADRFVLLLPRCTAAVGAELAADLKAALSSFTHATADGQARHRLPVRMACCGSDEPAPPDALLLALVGRLLP